MKSITLLAFLAPLATAYNWGQSCANETLDSATDILSASCNIGDGLGTFQTTSLDLNTCLAYTSDHKIAYAKNGNFSTSCDNCELYRLPDKTYGECCGITRPWLNCTCTDSTAEVALNLDGIRITNRYGVLTCP
ncbi:hypothetical protein B0O99DRAFT_631672 [Bisporella sp. PMI_857]|nr:hypothetical protein B0O99DRAFT_631672 [Bisporella sp. PMI_857]